MIFNIPHFTVGSFGRVTGSIKGPVESTVILTQVTLHSRALVLLKLGNSITEESYYQLL